MSPGGQFAGAAGGKGPKRKGGSLSGNPTELSSSLHRAEDTKVNFFDPDPYGRQVSGLYDIPDKPEEDKILETKIDPLEWKQEIDRVYRDLVNIEKEIEILKNQGGDDADFEECRRHIELILEMCSDIRQSSHHEVRKVFASSAEQLEEELALIRRNEIRINKQNEGAIGQLGEIT